MNYEKIENLMKEKLLELLKIYAKNWVVHNGCWFLAIEDGLGLEKAIEFDRKAWGNFTIIEARRFKEFLNLTDNVFEVYKRLSNFDYTQQTANKNPYLIVVDFINALKAVVFNNRAIGKACQISFLIHLVLLNIHILLR